MPNACAVTDLQGNSEAQGDLKSVVLHKMAMRSTQNTYPISLGIRISGVDDATFGQTGEAYSTIALPSMESHTALTLQEDDTALAYEFVRHLDSNHDSNLLSNLDHTLVRRASFRATPPIT